jgi:predicted transcriptional regulator
MSDKITKQIRENKARQMAILGFSIDTISQAIGVSTKQVSKYIKSVDKELKNLLELDIQRLLRVKNSMIDETLKLFLEAKSSGNTKEIRETIKVVLQACDSHEQLISRFGDLTQKVPQEPLRFNFIDAYKEPLEDEELERLRQKWRKSEEQPKETPLEARSEAKQPTPNIKLTENKEDYEVEDYQEEKPTTKVYCKDFVE